MHFLYTYTECCKLVVADYMGRSVSRRENKACAAAMQPGLFSLEDAHCPLIGSKEVIRNAMTVNVRLDQ